ncbi:MAG: Asp23/Gls24 family envelope stress response protein [Eggerthellaceae bacterium]|nr:Asp23/Gls24 family envelope stress response protein [Eggerthellaceae bacterium]
MTDPVSTQNMTLAPGVVDTIISITASETDGVASIGSPVTSGIRAMLSGGASTSGIETSTDEDGKLDVVVHINVYYGYVLPELAEKLRQSIADALAMQVGIQVGRVDVFIDGIQFRSQS